jgi:phosphoribosyl 1,2-cyclic phosphodiesterase
MRISFWGTRGSVPVPGAGTVRFGGNTPCVEVAAAGAAPVILDAGTGIRLLGDRLAINKDATNVVLFLTHTHWDHIQGLPFFAPLHQAGARIRIYGPNSPPGALDQAVKSLLTPAMFPVPFSRVSATTEFHAAPPQALEINQLEISALPVNHPGAAVGYRLHDAASGATALYVPDNEIQGQAASATEARARLAHAARDADVLIHDSTFLESEYGRYSGWGHSTCDDALALAREAGVKHLVLFHHAPQRNDDAVDAMVAHCRESAAADGGPRVSAAEEGTTIEI